MSDGGNNIYKYMTSDRKLNGENSKSEIRDMISYFEKSTGVFNGDGVISQKELKAIQGRAKANKMLWHGFISLNEEMSYKIDTPEKCIRLVKRTFGEFFRDMGLDPKNIDLICSLHKDKPHHLHIHFWFAEKEPNCKYRKRELEYRHKGKISKPVLDRMHVRLNSYVCGHEERLYMTREPYRKQVDETVKKILLYDRRARKADRAFHERLAKYETDIFVPFAKDIIKTDLFKKEFIDHYKVDPQNITVIDELRADYKRRQANIVLRAVKSIKPAIYESKFRHKVNDNGLKRRLAISHYKVGKLIGNFLSSFGEESEYLSRDYINRLQEIEDEMEQERKQREERENKVSRYQYGKE